MRYFAILENIEKLVIDNYPGKFRVIAQKSGETHYNTDKVEIQLIDKRFEETIVLKKKFQDLNEEIKEIGIGKFLSNLRILLGKYVREIFSRGDMFWGSNDFAHGEEQKGYRPYIIVSNNKNNNYSKLLTVVPLTTRDKKYLPTHKTIMINGIRSTAICEQITTVEKTDMIKYIRTLTSEELENIEEAIKIQLALNKSEEKEVKEDHEEEKLDVKKKKNWIVRLFEKLFKGEKKNGKRS